jgi:hypothetical protein
MKNNPITAEDMRAYIANHKIELTEQELEEMLIEKRDSHVYILALDIKYAVSEWLQHRLQARGFKVAYKGQYFISWGEAV